MVFPKVHLPRCQKHEYKAVSLKLLTQCFRNIGHPDAVPQSEASGRKTSDRVYASLESSTATQAPAKISSKPRVPIGKLAD